MWILLKWSLIVKQIVFKRRCETRTSCSPIFIHCWWPHTINVHILCSWHRSDFTIYLHDRGNGRCTDSITQSLAIMVATTVAFFRPHHHLIFFIKCLRIINELLLRRSFQSYTISEFWLGFSTSKSLHCIKICLFLAIC